MADRLTTILALITAAIPLMLAILSLILRQATKGSEPLDSRSLTILKLQRYPIADKEWKKISKRRFWYIFFLVGFFLVYFLIFIWIFANIGVHNQWVTYLVFLFYFISALAALLIIFLALLHPTAVFKDAYSGRGELFEDIDIVIESDFHYALNKCYEALKLMGFQMVEVDESKGKLETFRIPFWIIGIIPNFGRHAIQITVTITLRENAKNSFIIKLELKQEAGSHELSSVKKSKFVNRFLNRLISKSKGVDQKAESQ